MSKNYIIAQSGGPTVAINASLVGIVEKLKEAPNTGKIYGSLHGIQGVLKKELVDLSTYDNTLLTKIKYSPAMYLGSCRFRLPGNRDNEDTYKNIFSVFEELDIDTFFYIGGNDSMDTVLKLNAYAQNNHIDIRIIGVPKTIDNDLLVTDHTPGFGSAAKYVASTFREIAYDTHIYDLQSVTIVEVMGRDSGWLTAAAALARNSYNAAPQLIYLPEVPFSTSDFLEDVKRAMDSYQNIVIAVSEGIRDKDGHYIAAGVSESDQFGHSQLSGAGKVLEYLVKERLHVKVRSVEINILQRAAAHLSSLTDINEAYELGGAAAGYSFEKLSGIMTVLKRKDTKSYETEISYVDVSQVANKAKYVPSSMINDMGNDITNDMLEYLSPLVIGQVPVEYADGIVDYAPFLY